MTDDKKSFNLVNTGPDQFKLDVSATPASKPKRHHKKSKTITHESTLGGAVSDAMSEIQMLRDEMNDWKENLENNNLGSTPKFDDVETAHDELDEVADNEPEVPAKFPEGLEDRVIYTSERPYGRRAPSRAFRLDEALSGLRAVSTLIETFLDAHDPDHACWGDGTEDLRADWENYQSSIDEVVDGLEGVSFPGMY